MGKNKITSKAARRIQSHADRTQVKIKDLNQELRVLRRKIQIKNKNI